MSTADIVTIVAAVLGSGLLSTLANWLLKHVDRLEEAASRGDVQRVEAKVDSIGSKLDNDNRRLNQLEQASMRTELFARTRDRNQHEHQLEVGKTYLMRGFNGSGKVRIEQLRDAYSSRLQDDDWNYDHQPKNQPRLP